MPTDLKPASKSEARERDAVVASSGPVGGGACGPSWSLPPATAACIGARGHRRSCAQGS